MNKANVAINSVGRMCSVFSLRPFLVKQTTTLEGVCTLIYLKGRDAKL